MLTTSATYKTKIKASQRRVNGHAVVVFTGPGTYPLAIVNANNTKTGYTQAQACDGRYELTDYSMSGTYVNSSLSTPKIGWKGNNVSDALGVVTAQTIDLNYTTLRQCKNFWLVGSPDNYPVDFTIDYYTGSAWVNLVTVTNNTKAMYTYIAPNSISFVKLLYTITKISQPNTNPHVIECGAITTICFTSQQIVEMGGVEEIYPDSNSIVGGVSANDFYLKLYNEEDIFVAANTLSPLYQLFKTGIKIQPYVCLEVSADVFEPIPMGNYYVQSWNCNNEANEMTFNCLDYMAILKDKAIPEIPILVETNLSSYIDTIFTGITVSNYTKVNLPIIPLSYAWTPDSKMQSFLAAVAEAFPAAIWVNRAENIQIKYLTLTGNYISTWADDDLIISANNPQATFTGYTDLEINYNQIAIKEPQEVINMQNIIIPNNTTYTFTRIQINGVPLLVFSSIQIQGANTDLTTIIMQHSAHTLTMSITNAGAQKSLNIKGYGIILDIINSVYTYIDSLLNLSANLPKRTLPINNIYHQNKTVCDDYAPIAFRLIGTTVEDFDIQTRWDPSIELTDVVRLLDPAEGLDTVDCYIIRQNWNYDGALSATVNGKRVHT